MTLVESSAIPYAYHSKDIVIPTMINNWRLVVVDYNPHPLGIVFNDSKPAIRVGLGFVIMKRSPHHRLPEFIEFVNGWRKCEYTVTSRAEYDAIIAEEDRYQAFEALLLPGILVPDRPY